MRSRLLVASGLAAVALAIGCASLLSIPDRSLEWCDRPENKHDFCDDFDHADAGAGWIIGSTPGANFTFSSSTDTPPNALEVTTTPLALGAPTVVGLYQQFNQKFDHVHVGVDVRFSSIDLATEGGLSAELGFLLLEQQGFCIGAVVTPAGLGIVMRANSTDCTGVTNVPAEAGTITDDAGLTGFALVGPVPSLNQWSHISLDVKRNTNGSGVVGFDEDFPGRIAPPPIPPGYLTNLPPAVAIAASVVGPSGHVELEFDNVTVDFLAD